MFTTHFCGKEISRYGRENGRVDYRTFASCFDAVLCNGILGYRDSFEDWEQIGGYIDNTEELEKLRAELEEVEAKLEEATKEKKEAEEAYDKADTAYNGISEILEKFDNFEYDYNELDEAMRWNDTETPSGEELDTDDITSQLECLNLWGMREDIERHQNTAEEERDEAEERFEEAEEEINKLTKRKAELEEQIEELEAEEDEQQEVYQWYIVSDNGAQLIQDYLPHEVLYYNAELDLYVWGVTHYGTAWDYVLTSIPCETLEEQKQREAEEAKPKETTDFTEDELDSMIDELLDIFEESEAETATEEEQTEEEAETDGKTLIAFSTSELESLASDLCLSDADPISITERIGGEVVNEATPNAEAEPNELTQTLRDASGQPYTNGYTVRAIENRFGVPVGFTGKVTDIIGESDGLLWAEVTDDNGTVYRALADDWQSLGDSVWC